jgi:hypothetical protein
LNFIILGKIYKKKLKQWAQQQVCDYPLGFDQNLKNTTKIILFKFEICILHNFWVLE